MGPGKRSLVSQLGKNVLGRFSYCLLPYDQPGISYLKFGNDAVIRAGAAGNAPPQSTPLKITGQTSPLYWLNLSDISINDVPLNLPSGTFKRGNGPGTFIDSAAPLTMLITGAYNRVMDRLEAYFEKEHHLRRFDGSETYFLDVCYQMSKAFVAFPNMSFHFEGAVLRLGKQNLFLIDDDNFCLTMKSDDMFTVLGAAQQANIQFIHDIEAQQLTFTPRDCTQN